MLLYMNNDIISLYKYESLSHPVLSRLKSCVKKLISWNLFFLTYSLNIENYSSGKNRVTNMKNI